MEIHHVILKLFCNRLFGVKTSMFAILYVTKIYTLLLGPSKHWVRVYYQKSYMPFHALTFAGPQESCLNTSPLGKFHFDNKLIKKSTL